MNRPGRHGGAWPRRVGRPGCIAPACAPHGSLCTGGAGGPQNGRACVDGVIPGIFVVVFVVVVVVVILVAIKFLLPGYVIIFDIGHDVVIAVLARLRLAVVEIGNNHRADPARVPRRPWYRGGRRQHGCRPRQ
jgi:hypothetical protein